MGKGNLGQNNQMFGGSGGAIDPVMLAKIQQLNQANNIDPNTMQQMMQQQPMNQPTTPNNPQQMMAMQQEQMTQQQQQDQ